MNAQTKIQIRSHYTDVNKKITESIEKGFEGPLYQNQVVVNKNGKSWPAVGNYSVTTDFWYDDGPNHLPASERNPMNVLLKITVSRKEAAFSSGEEYLFNNGKLLFYFYSQTEEGAKVVTRIYFNNNGVMFKSSVKANELDLTSKYFLDTDYKELKPKPGIILSDSKNYQDLFIKSM